MYITIELKIDRLIGRFDLVRFGNLRKEKTIVKKVLGMVVHKAMVKSEEFFDVID